MVHLTINGRTAQAEEGEMLLDVIKRQGIDIPAICQHDAVEPSGSCRLCTVEITKADWDGWKNYVTSCLYPVADGLIVNTHSDAVNEIRKTLFDLYLARHPNSLFVQKLAAEYGVTETSFTEVPDGDDCILCGLCTRICDRMGFSAISTVGRGHSKEIAPPLKEAPPDCVGCLACAQSCPTGHIKFSEEGVSRSIWGKQFERITCSKCGKLTAITKEFADSLSKTQDIPREYFDICDECRRRETALTMGRLAHWVREEETA
ncbi:MAG: 2Fe-2S iron-sulfur cluster-binding protein [candidate division Zixibacteria bacterium]|nr:2Fe-2S iron-sulfur cluster-binding protein [candidate division Zixibacteria bacterium]